MKREGERKKERERERKEREREREKEKKKYIFVSPFYFVVLCAFRSIANLLIVKYNFQRIVRFCTICYAKLPTFPRAKIFAHITFDTRSHTRTHLYLEIEIFFNKTFSVEHVEFCFFVLLNFYARSVVTCSVILDIMDYRIIIYLLYCPFWCSCTLVGILNNYVHICL